MKANAPTRHRHSVEQVLAALRAYGSEIVGNRAQCPGHGGRGFNLAVWPREDGSAGVTCHSRHCKTHEILAPLRPYLGAPAIVATDVPQVSGRKSRPAPRPSGDVVRLDEAHATLMFAVPLREKLCADRALTHDVVSRYRIGWDGFFFRPTWRFTVPIRDEDGNIVSFIGHLPKSMRADHVRGVDVVEGVRRWPLACLDAAVYRRGDLVVICEAEMDALAVRSAGVPAYGAPGASSWHDAHAVELRDTYGVREVVIAGDDDTSGREFNVKVAGSCARAGIAASVIDWREVA